MSVADAYEAEAAKLRERAEAFRAKARGADSMAGKLEALARVNRSLTALMAAAVAWKPRANR